MGPFPVVGISSQRFLDSKQKVLHSLGKGLPSAPILYAPDANKIVAQFWAVGQEAQSGREAGGHSPGQGSSSAACLDLAVMITMTMTLCWMDCLYLAGCLLLCSFSLPGEWPWGKRLPPTLLSLLSTAFRDLALPFCSRSTLWRGGLLDWNPFADQIFLQGLWVNLSQWAPQLDKDTSIVMVPWEPRGQIGPR